MNYIEAFVTADHQTADLLTEQLAPFAEGGSVAQEQLGDPEDLDPKALLPGVMLKFWFAETVDTPAFRQKINAIVSSFGLDGATFTQLDSIDWTTEWRKNYRPILAGNQFVILPPWETNPEPNRTPILIDPGVAFGTGQHETTRLCISQLEKHVFPGASILDLGAGSAILSMAGHHLKAGQITAVEIDPDAVRSGRENLDLNGMVDAVSYLQGSLNVVAEGTWVFVVANILAVILIQLIREDGLLHRVKPGGRIIFSGIIDQQQAEFLAAIDQTLFEIEEITAEGQWIAVTAKRLEK